MSAEGNRAGRPPEPVRRGDRDAPLHRPTDVGGSSDGAPRCLRAKVQAQDRGMSVIEQWVRSLGGFAQKQQLVALGASDGALTVAVRQGSVRRARQGWYSTVEPGDDRFLAVRCGGRLTGLSAVRAEGGWVLERRGVLHVSVPRNAARLRSPRNRRVALSARRQHNVKVHWDDEELMSRGTATTVALRDALARVILDEDLETSVAALDWALHTGRIELSDLDRMLKVLPRRFRHIHDWADPDCESLPESLTRTRLRLRGHHVVSQVRLDNGQRIDLVVDGVIGLETDGEEFHRDSFVADRRKDIEITLAGFVPQRYPAEVIFHSWPLAAAAVEAALHHRRVGNSGTPAARTPKTPAGTGSAVLHPP